MPGFGSAHWMYIFILLVIVLIIWGPGKLPDLGAGMGRAIREFRKATQDIHDNVVSSTASEPKREEPRPADTASTVDSGEERRTPA